MSKITLDKTDRKILAVLEKQRGNRTRAALELGISRRTLHRKLQEYRAQGLLPGGEPGRSAVGADPDAPES